VAFPGFRGLGALMSFQIAADGMSQVFGWLSPMLARWGVTVLGGVTVIVLMVLALLQFVRKG
jgi:hypothetical protein